MYEEQQEKRRKFRELLENTASITIESQWRKVKELFADHPAYVNLDPYEALRVFESYIRDLEKESFERSRLAKEAQKRALRTARASFRVSLKFSIHLHKESLQFVAQLLLNELRTKGQISLFTKWSEISETLEANPEFKEIFSSSRYGRPMRFEQIDIFVTLLFCLVFHQRSCLKIIWTS